MNGLVLQCGGPTAVVNASLAALVRRWRVVTSGAALYGGRYGLAALRTGEWLPLVRPGARVAGVSQVAIAEGVDGGPGSEAWLSSMETTPGMALGGGRDRLQERDEEAAIRRLTDASVGTLFLIGGNGTMAAGRALASRARHAASALRIIGIPKTIDNDIPGTDVCPGYPSAARFLVAAVRDVAADVSSMRGYEDVVLIETMGRHSGWLAASTLLARSGAGSAPHLVLVPEEPVADEAFLEAVRGQHAAHGVCVVTVAEGVRDRAGTFLAEKCRNRDVERDASGQVILGRSGGPLPYLAALVRERLRLRCRLVRPDVLQRCSRAHLSPLDREIAAIAGAAAVDLAGGVQPGRPIMVALRQQAEGWRTEPVPLDRIRGERTLPLALLADPAPLARWVQAF